MASVKEMNDYLLRIARFIVATILVTVVAAVRAESPTKSSLVVIGERKAAPALALKGTDGKQVTLKNYEGKVVVLDFSGDLVHRM